MYDPNRLCLLVLGLCCILVITGERCWYGRSKTAGPIIVLVVVSRCYEGLEGAVRLIKLKADWVYSCRLVVAVTLLSPIPGAGLVLDLLKKDGLVLDTILGGVPNLVIYL